MKLRVSILKCNKGFTLVELIVVLVILAILAAFTIPAMLGFVEDAKSKASITLTREIYAAAQSAATEIFTKYDGKDLSGTNSNVTALKQDIGKKIQILTEKDIGFKTVIDGQTNNPSEQMMRVKVMILSIILANLLIKTVQRSGLSGIIVRGPLSSKPSGMLINLETIGRLF